VTSGNVISQTMLAAHRASTRFLFVRRKVLNLKESQSLRRIFHWPLNLTSTNAIQEHQTW
jgi:hypothetical protein